MTVPPFLLLLSAVLLLPSLTLAVVGSDATPTPFTIVISGAGPASLIFAHRFLRLNTGDSTNIVIYEKRSKPLRYVNSQDLITTSDNAFGFGVSQKSQMVLKKTPGLLEAVEAISQPTAFAPGINLRIVNRRELCAELLHELEQEFGSSKRLQVHFEMSVTNVDLDKQTVQVTDVSTNHTREIPYSLLIAADGANSVVRSKLIESGEVECERFYSDVTWKALQLPAQPSLDASTFVRYPKPFYKPHQFIKRDNGAIIPRYKDKFVLLNFRVPVDGNYHAGPQNNVNPFNAATPQELKGNITQVLPNVTNFPSDTVLEEFLNQKPGRESWMKLNRHYVPHGNVVLIGDASVGMYSLFGQGAASAMTQASILAETIAPISINDVSSEELLQHALEQYSNSSVIEGYAISDLNLLTHVLRRKGPLKFWAAFHMMSIGKTLSKKPEVPYSDIFKKKRRAMWFCRQFWKRVRVPAPATMTTKISTK